MLKQAPKGHRYPISIISNCIWLYHRFNNSYRDVQEQMLYRSIEVSHETIRKWCYKFSSHFADAIKKRLHKCSDKWHLDEMNIRINGEQFILWRAVDSNGYELDIFLQKRRDKKSAIRFLSRLLGSNPIPRVIVTDKLKSYKKPIKSMCKSAQHRSHKGLNNRAENAHLPTRRREKILIRFKSPHHVQSTLSLMGRVRNIFAIDASRYKLSAKNRKLAFVNAKNIWNDAALILAA